MSVIFGEPPEHRACRYNTVLENRAVDAAWRRADEREIRNLRAELPRMCAERAAVVHAAPLRLFAGGPGHPQASTRPLRPSPRGPR